MSAFSVDKYMLDACALTAYFRKEAGFGVLISLFEEVNEAKSVVYMNLTKWKKRKV